MKKLILFLLFAIVIPMQTYAYSEYAYLVKDDFGGSEKALMYTRESQYDNYDFYVVEYGIGCGLGAWKYEGKQVIVSTGNGTYLDGISDTLILPKTNYSRTSYSCKIWDIKPLVDVFDDLRTDDIEWLSNNGFF